MPKHRSQNILAPEMAALLKPLNYRTQNRITSMIIPVNLPECVDDIAPIYELPEISFGIFQSFEQILMTINLFS
jgi:hypothetical protein